MKSKINWSLWIAFLMPLILVGVVGLNLFLSSRSASFQGKFVYALSDNWYGGSLYAVNQGQIQWIEPQERTGYSGVRPSSSTVLLYLHDIATDQSEALTYDQARALVLDPVSTTREGVQIIYGYRGDSGLFPLFFGGTSDYGSVYATGKKASKRLNVSTQDPGHYRQFNFIGWIKS